MCCFAEDVRTKPNQCHAASRGPRFSCSHQGSADALLPHAIVDDQTLDFNVSRDDQEMMHGSSHPANRHAVQQGYQQQLIGVVLEPAEMLGHSIRVNVIAKLSRQRDQLEPVRWLGWPEQESMGMGHGRRCLYGSVRPTRNHQGTICAQWRAADMIVESADVPGLPKPSEQIIPAP